MGGTYKYKVEFYDIHTDKLTRTVTFCGTFGELCVFANWEARRNECWYWSTR